MNAKKKINLVTPQPKRSYKTPKLQTLGNVKKLTLKSGSATDGFGSFSG